MLFLIPPGGFLRALKVLLAAFEDEKWMALAIASDFLEKRDVGFLGELEVNLSYLFAIGWFIQCVAFTFFTL